MLHARTSDVKAATPGGTTERFGPLVRYIGVKTSGLPCRATSDCESVFTLTHQDSMDALREAAGRRDAHELDAHGYKHVVRDVAAATPFAQAAATHRRGRRRSEEMSPV